MHRVLRRTLKLAGILVLATLIAYTVSLVMVLVVSLQDQRRPVDAIVVLGAGVFGATLLRRRRLRA